jgi:acetyl-CoA carboxylase biotin carboxyl carrier protein
MAQVRANMAGIILQVLVSVGDRVELGQDVVLLESMKMEVPISSESNGEVKEIKVDVGSFVSDGEILLEIE